MSLYRDDIANIYGAPKVPVRKGRSGAASSLGKETRVVAGVTLHLDPEPHAGQGQSANHGEGEGTWIYSFCDLIMNLLMFFVMMFAISKIDDKKVSEVKQALASFSEKEVDDASQGRLGTGAGALSGVTEREQAPDVPREFESLTRKAARLAPLERTAASPELDREAFDVVVAQARLFAPGPRLTDEGGRLLARLARDLEAYGKPLRIAIQSELATQPTGAPGEDDLSLTSRQSWMVLEGLRKRGLGDGHKASIAGLGRPQGRFAPSFDRVVISVALMRGPEPGKTFMERTQ